VNDGLNKTNGNKGSLSILSCHCSNLVVCLGKEPKIATKTTDLGSDIRNMDLKYEAENFSYYVKLPHL